MSTQGTIKRYSLIIEKVGRKSHPTFDEIKSFLHAHDFEISPRTLQRDINQIRNEFGVEILYNATHRGYFVDAENSTDYKAFVRFLEVVGTANILLDTLREGKEVLKFISFENEAKLQGVEQLRQLVFAIKNKRKIEFLHENFDTEKVNSIKLLPYHLKQYQGRWYVFGNFENTNDYRTFGIDRISELKVLSKTFKPDKNVNAQEKFAEVVGLNYTASKLQQVQIKVDAYQAKYLKTLPLHSSQSIVKEAKQFVYFTYYLRPNFEFTQKLLTLGSSTTVIKPASLAKEIKDILKAAVKNYK